MSSVPADLQQALLLTAQMLDAAGVNDWERVASLDSTRQPLLAAARRPDPQWQECLAALQQHNQQVLTLASTAREQVEQQLGSHRYNHRALNTYITASG
jgi:tripartite-type tricarboxylate transporter receptor subunit TctC